MFVWSWVICCINSLSLIFRGLYAWNSMRLLIEHFFHCKLMFLMILYLFFLMGTSRLIRINIVLWFFTVKLVFILLSYLYFVTKAFFLNLLSYLIAGCFNNDFHLFIAFIWYLFWDWFVAFIDINDCFRIFWNLFFAPS